MAELVQFPFVQVTPEASTGGLLPYLPLTLTHREHSVPASGLLDTGATVNVMPYQLGVQLGAVWEAQTKTVQLTGNLAQVEACVLIVSATVSQFNPVRLAFAWTRSDNVPLILGQVNFFMEFDVCFYRSRAMFEIIPKQP